MFKEAFELGIRQAVAKEVAMKTVDAVEDSVLKKLFESALYQAVTKKKLQWKRSMRSRTVFK